ncbi:Integrin-linked kinase associated phosphatase [Dirofilaria immitis]|nr:Integrin-linked kinase associated phosphatase [Dirofilaria immitis]
MATKRKMMPPLTISLYRDLMMIRLSLENQKIRQKQMMVMQIPVVIHRRNPGTTVQHPKDQERLVMMTVLVGGRLLHSLKRRVFNCPFLIDKLVSVCGWRKGERQDMQDAHVRLDQFGLTAICNIQRSAFYAIFDGHAGRRAADFAAERLPSRLKKKLEACRRPSWKDGTTATTILLVNNIIYCANIGDSKAVVCRSKLGTEEAKDVAMQLTVDHSPLHFEERMRIQKAGGNVKDGRIMGILEVSRSIGDGQFKAYGLICTPDVKKFSITKDDIFVLVACDGLWKTFSNQQAVDYVMAKIRELTKPGVEQESETREMIWQNVADDLAAESVKRGCGDNVSVIIVVLNDL